MAHPWHKLTEPVTAIGLYWQGYFPLYDPAGEFVWVRCADRAILPLTDQVAARARRMMRKRGYRFTLTKNRHFAQVIAHLRDPRIKENTWVRQEVVELYEALRAAGLLVTLEAVNEQGQLAGGLVGIVLPGVFVAETMFYLEPDASKVCLCALLVETHRRGFAFMDVQTPHDRDELGFPRLRRPGEAAHPCVRLGEQTMPDHAFLLKLAKTLRSSWPGSVRDWVRAATQIKHLADRGGLPPGLPADSPAFPLASAWRWLQVIYEAGGLPAA